MTAERKAALILGGCAALEGTWVVGNLAAHGWKLVRYLGFWPGRAGDGPGWIAAAVVAALFVANARRLPSVRENLLRPSFLKALAIALAVSAGILEEVIFRKWVMDALFVRNYGAVLQVLGAAFSFGIVHAIWGLMGKSLRAALGAMIATGVLGGMLGVVYLLAGRSLAPCIAAHFVINLLIEPGLVLAATRGEMGRARR
jgi:membrane protease YdiL (CAAX protease family)